MPIAPPIARPLPSRVPRPPQTPMTIALIAIRLAEFLFRCDRTRTKSLIAADLSVRFKCRSDLPAALRESNYSIYSINGGFEERPRGISELGCLVSTPWTHKSFIDKRRLTSQAGRRRSDCWKCRLVVIPRIFAPIPVPVQESALPHLTMEVSPASKGMIAVGTAARNSKNVWPPGRLFRGGCGCQL